MVLDYQYTYTKKFNGKELDTKETFVLRTIKRELQKNIDFDLSDDMFLELYKAVFECRIAAPLGWAKRSIIEPFHKILIRYGLEEADKCGKSYQIGRFFFPHAMNQ